MTLRGDILRLIAKQGEATAREIRQSTGAPKGSVSVTCWRLQAEGKIVVVSTFNRGGHDAFVWRLAPDGTAPNPTQDKCRKKPPVGPYPQPPVPEIERAMRGWRV